MSKVRVKICGVRSYEEAQTAFDFGADALGFNFWIGSPRYIAPESARAIISKLPPFASCIGVFVNEQAQRIKELVDEVGLNAAQLHGDETPEFCASFEAVKIIKAIRVGQDFDLSLLQKYPVSAMLLDASVKGQYGGTGRQFDWRVAIEAQRLVPLILAGGLTIENVADAITQVRPLAIDVCSGIEAEPGRKDPDKLRRFMEAVERANASIAGR